MANPEHIKVVRQGAAAIAEWRQQNPGVPLDLTKADLSHADLRGAALSGADLTRADLSVANLSQANLSGADLHRADLLVADLTAANLTGAHLEWADLTGAHLPGAHLIETELTGANLCLADLTGADLTGAYLHLANLTETDLTRANLAEANLGSTSLNNCDLSRATGLSAVDHKWPSSIGVDTLIASFRGAGNKLTPDLETFFLGAGVPRELLAELPRIVAEVKYYSCFIAYGQPDLDFAKKLHDGLVASGVSCWIYDLDATPGERTWREIGRKRREADKMVVICSAAALIRPGVLKEIEEQVDEDPNKMVPISRDDLWREPGFRVERAGHDLKPPLLDKNYADFSDESCYEESMQRLLTALRRKAE